MITQVRERPSWLRTATEMEAAGWRSTFAWLARSPRVPVGATAFPYVAAQSAVLWVFIGLSAVEIPIFDLMLRAWPWARFPVLVLGIWSLTFMIGYALSMVVNPHAVGPEGLRIRHSTTIDIAVPWLEIRSITGRQRGLEQSKAVQVKDDVLHVSIMSETNVDIELAGPLTLSLPSGDVTVSRIRFRADDPAALVSAVREHL